jgi:hypothetical protein
MHHDQVDHAVHLSAWIAGPALPAIVDSGEGETALRALWADRLFPVQSKTQLLRDFQVLIPMKVVGDSDLIPVTVPK